MFFNISTPKFAAQAIKKVAEIEWKPLHFLNNVSASIGSVDQAGRLRQRAGHHLVGLPQGSDRSAVEERCGHEGLQRLPRQILSRKPTAPTPRGLRLHRRADHGLGAEALRRRSHARERHEAGRQHQGPRARRLAARHQDQHQRDRFCPAVDNCSWRNFKGETWQLFGDIISARSRRLTLRPAQSGRD